MGRKILLVEDDRETASYLANGLSQEGHSVEQSANGQDGLFRATDGSMVTSAGWMMAEQVVLGAAIGGFFTALFEFALPALKVGHPSPKNARKQERQS